VQNRWPAQANRLYLSNMPRSAPLDRIKRRLYAQQHCQM